MARENEGKNNGIAASRSWGTIRQVLTTSPFLSSEFWLREPGPGRSMERSARLDFYFYFLALWMRCAARRCENCSARRNLA